MKRFLTTLLSLGMVLPLPATAHLTLEDIPEQTYASMGCMKLGECTEGVEQVHFDQYEGEAREILAHLTDLGVDVFVASHEYFVDDWRAVYYADVNRIYLNEQWAREPVWFLRLLRHEGLHAAQDCMAGSLVNSDLIQIFNATDIPPEYTQDTIDRYGTDPFTVRVEREAVWATNVPGKTVEVLGVCNSNKKMWNVFEPQGPGKSYLYINGHI